MGLVMGLSFVFPVHWHPYRNFFHEIISVLAIVSTVASFCVSKTISLRIPNLVCIPLILMGVIALQIQMGMMVAPMDLVFPLLTFLALVLALICGATIAAQEEGLKRLCLALSYCFVVVGLISVLLQHLQVAQLPLAPFVFPIAPYAPRPYGNLAQPNLLALLLCFAVISTWYLVLLRKLNGLAGIFIAVILLWGIALTQSRIALFILPMFAICCSYRSELSQRIPKGIFLALLLTYLGMILALPTVMSWCGVAMQTVTQRAGQTSSRIVIWEQALGMIQMHPWFGVGWFQFGAAQARLATHFQPTEYAEYAHNIVLNLAAEIGIPLTVILIIVGLTWFYFSCIKRWRSIEVCLISLMLLAVIIHSMVEFPLWFAFFSMPVALMIGALQPNKGLTKVVIDRVWIMLITLLVVASVRFILLDYRQVVEGFFKMNWNGRTNTAQIENSVPVRTLFPQFYDLFRVDKVSLAKDAPKADIQFLEKMSVRFAYPYVMDRLALAYANNKRADDAYMVLLTIHQLHLGSYSASIELWKEHARENKSNSVFEDVLNKLPKP